MSGLYPRKGQIAVGADVDVVVFDPDFKGTISNATSLHGIDYSPFEGFPIQGRPDQVFLRGKLVAEKGKFVGEKGKGEWVRSKPYALCYDYYKLQEKLPFER